MNDNENEMNVPRLSTAERITAVRGGGYFPVLIKLQDGSLGAVVRGGAPHVGIEGRLDWIHSENGGKTWSKPEVIVDNEFDDRNPAFGQMPDGTIVMAYAEASTYNDEGKFDTSVGAYIMYFVISTDGGKSWSAKQRLPQGPIRNGSPFGRIILLPDGTALMPLYGGLAPNYHGSIEIPEGTKHITGLLRSTDNGRSWGDFSIISVTGHNETSLLYLSDGRLLAFSRTYDGARIELLTSTDLGRNWSTPRRITRDRQHPADILRLQSGNLHLVYGNRIEPYGVGGLLTPCVSQNTDNGETWDYERRVMIGWTSMNTDCGYPSAVQLDDGTIVTMYYSVGTQDMPADEFALVVRYTEEDIRQCYN